MADVPTVEETKPNISLGALLSAVESGLAEQGGHLVVNHDEDGGDWVVGIFFGKEAPDSDMYGGAAHGIAPSLLEALQQAVDETGWLDR